MTTSTTDQQRYWIGIFDDELEKFVPEAILDIDADQFLNLLVLLHKDHKSEDIWSHIQCGVM